MRKWPWMICVFLVQAGWVDFLWAQNDKTIDIPFIEKAPTLDDFTGMAPAEGIEEQMMKVTGFIQREPTDGAPASFATVVYLAYDRKNLYAVFLAFDPETEKIRAHMAPRENVFDDDYVNIQIDTFNDQRRAYTFLSTPLGIQWDALWTEGQDFDSTYQALWYSKARINKQGYMVLITIPFSSLRFPRNGEQVWGIILHRTISRLDELSYWPHYSNRIAGRLNQEGTMRGIRDISPGRNIQLNPFGFARNIRILDPEAEGGPAFTSDDFDPEVGLDAKMVIKDSLVLDLTINPDFSQVESDEPQVTVNQRFETFFPERRPFFLENADFFRTPINLVFTRRIVDPSVGARLTGKKGSYALGAMLIDDEAPGMELDGDDPRFGEKAKIGIFRLSRDVSAQSTLGVLYANREFGEDYNRVGAIDGRIKLNENWITRFQVAGATTREEGEERDGTAYDVALDRSGRHLSNHLHFLRTGDGFRTELGFIPGPRRPGTQNIHNIISYTFRPEHSRLLSWGTSFRVNELWDTDEKRLDWDVSPEIFWQWIGDTRIEIGLEKGHQRLEPEEFPELAADKDLEVTEWFFEFSSDYFSKLSFSTEFEWGSEINFVPPEGMEPEQADSLEIQAGLTLRPISPLRIDNDYFYVALEDRNDRGRIFTNEIFRLRGNWQFTREFSLRVIMQYDDTEVNEVLTSLTHSRTLNSDILLRYIINPWTAFYLGYNNNASNFEIVETGMGRELVTTGDDLKTEGKQYFFKISYLFQF